MTSTCLVVPVHGKSSQHHQHSKQTKKKKSGGAWGAFLRLSSLGQVGTPNLQALAGEYRKKKLDGSLKHAEAMGRARALVVESKVTAVYKQTRTIQAERKKQLQMAFFQRHKSMNFVDQALLIQSDCTDLGTIPSAFQMAHAIQKLASAEKKAAHDERLLQMAKYENDIGKAEVATLLQGLPSLQAMALKAIPHVGGLHIFEVQTDKVLDKAMKTLAWLSSHKQTNVGVGLDFLWQSIHSTVPDKKLQEHGLVATENEEENLTACQRAGMCLCSLGGKQLQTCRNRFLKLLKEVFNTVGQQGAAQIRTCGCGHFCGKSRWN
eukprot:4372369-Amphidinium_carterae.3